MISTQQVWENALIALQSDISKANFNTWFKNTHIESIGNGVVTIGVESEFIREWLLTKYHKTILKAVRKVFPDTRAVEYVVAKKKPENTTVVGGIGTSSFSSPHSALSSSSTTPVFSSPMNTGELPLRDLYINKDTNLNSRYTFDSFIIGSFNELAYSAAQAIIKKPGVYNPLFIYGETGLGKTHLIQAIGNEILSKHPGIKLYYTSSEKFTGELVSALQKNQPELFKQKYRKFDVFIMDDIQFLSGKDKTQEELFHLFNNLYDMNKQIIFSSDKHPNYIIGLEDRLKSRFSAGMIVDINKPDYESRVAIIKTKLKISGLGLAENSIEYIAQNIEGNIREIEGTLNTLICQAELKGGSLSFEEVKTAIKNSVKSRKQVSVQDVVYVVAQFYNLDHALVFDKTRRKEVVHTRQMAMYILREDFSISFPHIGRELGGRDHTTVIHSCVKVKESLEKDPVLVQELEQIRSMLQTY